MRTILFPKTVCAALLTVSALLGSGACFSAVPAPTRPLELRIHRHGRTSAVGPCTFLSLTTVQHHRGLRGDADVLEKTGSIFEERAPRPGRAPASDLEYIQLVSHSQALLWGRAESICGPASTWSFPVYVAEPPHPRILSSSFTEEDREQAVFFGSLEYEQTFLNTVSPPALELSPLVSSGPSSNRVDLVFFSDGCAYVQ